MPEPQASELEQATAALEAARDAWHQAVLAAIDTGASLREIALLAGVSHGTIEGIAKRR